MVMKAKSIPLSEIQRWNNMSPTFHLEILSTMKKLRTKSFKFANALKSYNSEEVTRLYNLYQKHLKLQEEILKMKKEMGLC